MGPYDPIYETAVVKFLHLCFGTAIFIFFFSDRWSLKIENENNKKKTLTADPIYRTRVPRVQFIHVELYPGYLELPLT